MGVGKVPIIEIGIPVIIEGITANKVTLFNQTNNLMKENIFLMVFYKHKSIKNDNTLIRLDKNNLTWLVIFIVRGLNKALHELRGESLKK
jgi:hypothetical protein